MATGDVYDEEFNRYLSFAKTLISQVKKKADREICTKWITKLCDLRSTDAVVKKHRNHFFRYMLTVIHKGVDEVPEPHKEFPQYDDRAGNLNQSIGAKGYMSRWSTDKRTYVAVKPLPGKGALVYMAVSKDPKLGWDTEKRPH